MNIYLRLHNETYLSVVRVSARDVTVFDGSTTDTRSHHYASLHSNVSEVDLLAIYDAYRCNDKEAMTYFAIKYAKA